MDYNTNKKKASVFERLGDRFSTADDAAAYTAGVVDQINQKIDNLSPNGGSNMPSETTQIRFQETLASLTGDKFTYKCPWDGTITNVAIHFPAGCNALVDVAVGHSDKQTYPRQDFIALNDTSPVFIVSDDVSYNEPLWVEIRNADSGFSHTISVILTLRRKIQ